MTVSKIKKITEEIRVIRMNIGMLVGTPYYLQERRRLEKLKEERLKYKEEYKEKMKVVMYSKNKPKTSHYKMFKCGNIIELYEYENPYFYDYKDDRKGGRAPKDEDEKRRVPVVDRDTGEILDYCYSTSPQFVSGFEGLEDFKERLKTEEGKETVSDRRIRTLHRSKKQVLRYANANSSTLNKFLTLTFRDNVQDVDTANREFDKFIRRLNRYLRKEDRGPLRYICVVEFQQRGAVHYHLLCNLAFMRKKKLEDIWGQGFVDIKRIDRVDNIGAYMTKYMSKSLGDKRLEGRKSFFKSQNLNDPIEIKQENHVLAEIKKIPEGVEPFEVETESEHLGKIIYRQYNLNKLND